MEFFLLSNVLGNGNRRIFNFGEKSAVLNTHAKVQWKLTLGTKKILNQGLETFFLNPHVIKNRRKCQHIQLINTLRWILL